MAMVVSKIISFHEISEKVPCFLNEANYRKFAHWPQVTKEKCSEYLFQRIAAIQDPDLIFLAEEDGTIISLLTLKNLEWDTSHFGFKCASIDFILNAAGICEELLQKSMESILLQVTGHCFEEKIRFISTSIDSWDRIALNAFSRMNYRFILTWMDGFFRTSNTTAETENDPEEIGIMVEDEISYFQKISSRSYFKGGRFYLDSGFSENHVNEMYEKLVENSFRNGDIMLVYRRNKEPVGLFICKKITEYGSFSNLQVAPLRYLIVDPEFREMNIGKNLFTGVLNYLSPLCDLITTGFEIHNLRSLNLHASLGFQFNFSHSVFHRWFD